MAASVPLAPPPMIAMTGPRAGTRPGPGRLCVLAVIAGPRAPGG